MSYKTILVQVDDSAAAPARMVLAARLALDYEAHLVGAAATGIARYIADTVTFDAMAPDIAPLIASLRQRADLALDRFDQISAAAGLGTRERRRIDDEVDEGLRLQARYCDLAVVGQADPDGAAPGESPQEVVLGSGCPVLVVPYGGAPAVAPKRVLLAWNGSAGALRAVHGALPMLRRASLVQVLVMGDSAHGAEPGADLALYLARHHIKVEVLQEREDNSPGTVMLERAREHGSEMLVMGCYGHSRLREMLLGGATRTVLATMHLPVLMAH
ncbi:MAG: universal stress protein [Pseudomonadota bacterium]